MQLTETTLTDRPLAERLGDLLRELFLDPDADHLGAIENRELTLTQVRALLLLACSAEHDRVVHIGDVAERLGVSTPAMSRAFATLVERGFVTRREGEGDRRARQVAIAPAGTEVVDEIVSLRTAGLERFLERLDGDQRDLLETALVAIQREPDE